MGDNSHEATPEILRIKKEKIKEKRRKERKRKEREKERNGKRKQKKEKMLTSFRISCLCPLF
jgi:hypothetical protein